MKREDIAPLHLLQLHSVPFANQAATAGRSSAGGMQLSVPLKQPAWVAAVRYLFPLSKEKNIELDQLGADIFSLCDGKHTVEQIIDLHKDRWKLSFFESRAMVLSFLHHLMRSNFIVIVTAR